MDNFLNDLMVEMRKSNFLLFTIAQALRNPDNIDVPDCSAHLLADMKERYDEMVFGPLEEEKEED